MRGHLDVQNEKQQTKPDERQPGGCDRQDGDGIKRQQKRDSPHHSGENGAGVLKLEENTHGGESEQNQEQIGIGQLVQEAILGTGRYLNCCRTFRMKGGLLVFDFCGASIQPFEQFLHIGLERIHHLQFQGLRGRDSCAFPHRLFRPVRIASIGFGDSTRLRSKGVDDLLHDGGGLLPHLFPFLRRRLRSWN